MTIMIIVVALALCAVAMFYVAVRSRRSHAIQRSIDIKAFRVLMDRDDENFLRVKLSRNMFFRIKRQRIRVAWRYVARISSNSEAVLRQIGAARVNPDPRIVEQAAQAIELASQIRIQCLAAYAKMAAEFTFPSLQLTPTLVESKYESLCNTVAQLTSLQTQNEAPTAVTI